MGSHDELTAVGLGFAGIGILSLVASLGVIRGNRRVGRLWLRLPGVVIANRRVHSRTPATPGQIRPVAASTAAVVSYVDADGCNRELTSRVSTTPPQHRVGDQVQVLCDPQGRRPPRIAGEGTLAIPVILGVLGSLALLVGVILCATANG